MSIIEILKQVCVLKRHTKYSIEEINDLKRRKLTKLLEYVWDNSIYYKRSFEQAGISRDMLKTIGLSQIPIVDKKKFMDNFDEIVTDKYITQEDLREFDKLNTVSTISYAKKYHIVHSSGSTGKPAYYVYDDKAWSTMLAGSIRAVLWDMTLPQILKLLIKRPRIAYIAAIDGRYGGAMAVGDGINKIGAKQLLLDINEPLNNWIKKMAQFNPDIIIGYPSAIKIVAEQIKENMLSINPKRIITCGEPLGANLRNYIESIFKVKVVNFYGASESLALGVEIDSKEGMWLFDDMNIIEVENGNTYITCLYNFTQPIIRYRLTDSMRLKKPNKKAKYAFYRADGLIGRDEDILWFQNKNGEKEFLHPLAIEGICIQGLKDYQFIQRSNDTFEMYAQVQNGIQKLKVKEKILEQMQDILKSKKLNYVHFYVNFTDKIIINKKTGKKHLIINAENN